MPTESKYTNLQIPVFWLRLKPTNCPSQLHANGYAAFVTYYSRDKLYTGSHRDFRKHFHIFLYFSTTGHSMNFIDIILQMYKSFVNKML